MAVPDPSLAAPRLYDEVAPLTASEVANGYPLWQLCRALAAPKEQAQLLVDGHDEPWGVVMDAETCPEWGMDWLAQFAGVTLTQGTSTTIRRGELRSDSRRRRGTPGMMIAAAQAHLTGTKAVVLRERDGSPYRLTVLTLAVETPEPALVEAALRAQKPAGLLLDYRTITGQDYQQLAASYVTYSDVAAAFVDYGDVADNTPGP